MHRRVQSHYNDSVIRHSQAQWSTVMAWCESILRSKSSYYSMR